jgi:hypothetical protein
MMPLYRPSKMEETEFISGRQGRNQAMQTIFILFAMIGDIRHVVYENVICIIKVSSPGINALEEN